MTVQVYLGLGANIEPERCLRAGVKLLRDTFVNLQLSPVYQTQAVGINGPDFLNMVVGFSTCMPLAELQAWIKLMETKHGRDRSEPQPSCHRLDMDVLLYGNLISEADKVPRTDVLERAYVLRPLADVAPDLVYPDSQQTISQLWQASQLDQMTEVYTLDFAG